MTLRTSNGVPFTVLAPEPTVRTGILVKVYDGQNPATLLDILPRTRAREWLDQLNDPGNGSFEIWEKDEKLVADPTLLDYGNIVRFELDGVDRFAFVIEHREYVKASEEEDGGRWIKVSGRGVLSLIEHAVVYLSGGLTGNAERDFTGQKAGAIMKTLYDEARARNALGGITLGFTATDDTENAPFTEVLDLKERAGADLLQVAQTHAELAVDVAMSPQLELRYYNERGVDRSFQTTDAAPVVLRPAHNISELAIEAEGVIKNTLLIETPTGWGEQEDGPSRTTYGRREGYLSMGGANSTDQINRSARAALRENANPREAITIKVEDLAGHRPYVDWDVGDWVLAPDTAGVLTKYRVRAITVSEDEEGKPVFTPELATLHRELEERYQRWLKRMSNGTLGGMATEVAAPMQDARASSAAQDKIDSHSATASHPDELGDLSDVDTTGVALGKLLRHNGTEWVVSDPSDHGTHGGGDAPRHKLATASADLTLTTSEQDIAGASVSLDQDGIWMILGVFDFDGGTGINLGRLNFDGTTVGGEAHANGQRVTTSQIWTVTVTGQPKTAKLVGLRSGGSGGQIRTGHTRIAAWRVSS